MRRIRSSKSIRLLTHTFCCYTRRSVIDLLCSTDFISSIFSRAAIKICDHSFHIYSICSWNTV